jgi:hypothetical protein
MRKGQRRSISFCASPRTLHRVPPSRRARAVRSPPALRVYKFRHVAMWAKWLIFVVRSWFPQIRRNVAYGHAVRLPIGRGPAAQVARPA